MGCICDSAIYECAPPRGFRGKSIIFIGYPDAIYYNLPERLGCFNLYNDFFLSELPMETAPVFERYTGPKKKNIPNIKEAAAGLEAELAEVKTLEGANLGLPKDVCRNAAELLYFQPYIIAPCATDEHGVELRNERIFSLLIQQLKTAFLGTNPEQFNNFVFTGGWKHVKYMASHPECFKPLKVCPYCFIF